MDTDSKSILGIIAGIIFAFALTAYVLIDQDNRMDKKMADAGYVFVPTVNGHWERSK